MVLTICSSFGPLGFEGVCDAAPGRLFRVEPLGELIAASRCVTVNPLG